MPRCYQLLGMGGGGGCHRGLWVFSGRTPSETSSPRQERYAQKSPLALCRSYVPGKKLSGATGFWLHVDPRESALLSPPSAICPLGGSFHRSQVYLRPRRRKRVQRMSWTCAVFPKLQPRYPRCPVYSLVLCVFHSEQGLVILLKRHPLAHAQETCNTARNDQ